MIIDCIADLHGYEPDLPGGDLLILAGDYTAADKLTQWAKFFSWLKKQNYRKKILVAGNHDHFLELAFKNLELKTAHGLLEELDEEKSEDFEYLCDSGIEFEGFKIWGSPWSPLFYGVNPRCAAFMKSERFLAKKFALIPSDTDILITHTPPFGVLDSISNLFCGSLSLEKRMRKINPRMHVFGHIHECGGRIFKNQRGGISLNVSYVDERYMPKNAAMRIEL